jgi:hypothetical protein
MRARCAGQVLGVKQAQTEGDVCIICGAHPINIAVQTKCCSGRCCYMCVQQQWQRSVQPACPACLEPLREVALQAVLVEKEDVIRGGDGAAS